MLNATEDRDATSTHLQSPEMRFSLNSASFRIPLDELAPLARQSNFRGLELWSKDITEELPRDQVNNLLRANDLQVSAFQLLRDYEGSPDHLRTQRLEEAERIMSDMLAIGARTLLLCGNTLAECSEDRRQIAADLLHLAKMAAHRGLRIGLEPLAWSRLLNNYKDATRCILEVDHPSMGLTIDAFHWFWAETPIGFAREIPISKCFEIQLCDARPNGLNPIQIARHHRLFPGEGVWPVAELALEFSNRGFDGYFNIEVFNDQLKDLPAQVFIDRAVQSLNAIF